MMQSFLFIVFAVFISSCFAQKAERNLYAEALSACVNEEAVDYGKSGRDYKHHLVLKHDGVTNDLPVQFGEIRVEYLTEDELAKRYKKNHQELQILTMNSMESDGTKITINTASRFFSTKISSKQRKYFYALEGGCSTEFSYDPEQKQFILTKTELWGV